MPSFVHIITGHSNMNIGRYQLPRIFIEAFVQTKPTKKNTILSLPWLRIGDITEKLIVGNIF